MDYTLAKQLKDAGFPKKDFTITEYSSGMAIVSWPTLDELIEACGEGFKVLIRANNNSGWVAYSGDDLMGDKFYKTPSESVARLWLAINKK